VEKIGFKPGVKERGTDAVEMMEVESEREES